MKRVIEGHTLNRVWFYVGYLTLDIVRDRVSGRVRDRVAERVRVRVQNRVRDRVCDRVRVRTVNETE